MWTLFTESDDGSKLMVDGTLVVDIDGLHGMVEWAAQSKWPSRARSPWVEFFERGGGAVLIVVGKGQVFRNRWCQVPLGGRWDKTQRPMPAGTAQAYRLEHSGFHTLACEGEHLIAVLASRVSTVHSTGGKVGDAEGPVVGDLLHTGPLLGNHVGEL